MRRRLTAQVRTAIAFVLGVVAIALAGDQAAWGSMRSAYWLGAIGTLAISGGGWKLFWRVAMGGLTLYPVRDWDPDAAPVPPEEANP